MCNSLPGTVLKQRSSVPNNSIIKFVIVNVCCSVCQLGLRLNLHSLCYCRFDGHFLQVSRHIKMLACLSHWPCTVPWRRSHCQQYLQSYKVYQMNQLPVMISFSPRNAMHSAYYAIARCLCVCLSVRMSVTRRCSVEYIIKLFSPSIAIFDQYLAISQKQCNIRLHLLWNENGNSYNSYTIYQMWHFQWPWVTPNPDFKIMILFNVK